MPEFRPSSHPVLATDESSKQSRPMLHLRIPAGWKAGRWNASLCIPALCLSAAVACNSAPEPSSQPITQTHETGPSTRVAHDFPGGELKDADSLQAVSGSGIVASAGYRSRQSAYLQTCANQAGPGGGGLYAQLCLLAKGVGPLNEAKIRDDLAFINSREDTADFRLTAVVRILALYGNSPLLSPALKSEMEQTVLNFKYWLDEPGTDNLCWWSENHQALFHSLEIVAGQLFPTQVFPNSGMTGAEHVAHALPLMMDWLDRRGTFGFSEWHSNVYFNEDMPALLNLADFATDPTIQLKAMLTLDVIGFDFASTYYKGHFATVHGRTYADKQVGGSNDSTGAAAYIMLGLGASDDSDNFTGVFLATSPQYYPPDLLESVAQDAVASLEHKQRDGIDVADGPDYGIGYTDPEDVMFYWGMGAYADYRVIDGTLDAVNYYDLWDDYFWSSVAFLEPYSNSPIYTPLARFIQDIASGSALESMSTYVYRTPDYQLSGAQDYNPGYWGSQQLIWQAAIDADAVIFTTAPGGMTGDYTAGDWTGGWLPRATFYQNVGVIQYDRREHPIGNQLLFVKMTHAYFPTWAFDEVVQSSGWTLGRKGKSYVALYSQNPTQWSTDAPDYELVAEGEKNVWIVELGTEAEYGSFSAFVTAITQASVRIASASDATRVTAGNKVQYDSPSQGKVEVGSSGPMTVGGLPVDIGPYERFDNRYAYQAFGSQHTTIAFDGRYLELDYANGVRTVHY